MYVAHEDDLARVPPALLVLIGEPCFVMDLDLAERARLAQADPVEVMRQVREQGFYLQMPPGENLPVH